VGILERLKSVLPPVKEGHKILPGPEIYRLAGLCEGILIDDAVSREEADYLHEWLKRDKRYSKDFRTAPILKNVSSALSDCKLSKKEAAGLRSELSDFCDRVLDDFDPLTPLTRDDLEQRPKKRKRKKKKSSFFLPPDPGDAFEILYMAANGDVTERQINFRGCETKSAYIYIDAFCLTRHAFRTFRADRILDATHLDTGECIDDPESYFSAV